MDARFGGGGDINFLEFCEEILPIPTKSNDAVRATSLTDFQCDMDHVLIEWIGESISFFYLIAVFYNLHKSLTCGARKR